MSYTLPSRATIITRFLERYPEAGNTRAVQLFQKAFNWAMDIAAPRYSTITVNLVAGTNEYTLDTDVLRVQTVEYLFSATWSNKLEAVTIDELDVTVIGWRNFSGQPIKYYALSEASGNTAINRVGLYPNPQTTTSGGYPALRLSCNLVDDFGTSDTLPPVLRDENAILSRMYYFNCVDLYPKDAALYKQLSDSFGDETKTRAELLHAEVEPAMMTGPKFRRRSRY